MMPAMARFNVETVAIYTRVSTRDKGQDILNQLSPIRELCAKEGWPIWRDYQDHDSGSRADRAQFQQMLKDAAAKKFNLLIFWSLDRFTREGTLATLKYLEHLGNFGVRWISLTEPWINSSGPLRDVVISLVASLAKQEQVRISERVKAGLQRAKRGGTRTGNPIGRPRAVFDRDKARTLRDQGLSWHQIAKQLNVSASTVRRACTTQEDQLPLPKSEPEVLEGMSQDPPNRDSVRLLPEGP
jgi:DNA invertase Pin-like site-specific DNA recombinase